MPKKKPAKKKESKQERAAKWKNPPLLTDGKGDAKLAKAAPVEVMLSKPEAQKLQRSDPRGNQRRGEQADSRLPSRLTPIHSRRGLEGSRLSGTKRMAES